MRCRAVAGAVLVLAGVQHTEGSPGGTGNTACHTPNQPNDPGHKGMSSCTKWPADGPQRPTSPLPASARHPIMLVPSMLGSWLERKITHSTEPYPICADGGWMGGSDWYNMWPPKGLDPKCSKHDTQSSPQLDFQGHL